MCCLSLSLCPALSFSAFHYYHCLRADRPTNWPRHTPEGRKESSLSTLNLQLPLIILPPFPHPSPNPLTRPFPPPSSSFYHFFLHLSLTTLFYNSPHVFSKGCTFVLYQSIRSFHSLLASASYTLFLDLRNLPSALVGSVLDKSQLISFPAATSNNQRTHSHIRSV